MNYQKLYHLSLLRKSGDISEEEFLNEKAKLGKQCSSPFLPGEKLGLDRDSYCMFLHLSHFCGYFIPLIGFAVPILLWILNKEDKKIDQQGKVVINWMFSSAIYALISIILSSIVIGLVTLVILIILDIVFPMIGTFKAKKGIIWKYPLSIKFFSIDEV